MSHPALVTLDGGSAPRVLASGDRLKEFVLPTGTRVLYPRRAMACEANVAFALRRALDEPHESESLRARLRPGMRVAIALDALFIGAPQEGSDVHATAIDVLLPLLANCGVTDVRIIVATGIHRRLRARELRHLLAPDVYSRQQAFNVHLHDPEASGNMVTVGHTADGLAVEVERAVADASLLITVAVTGHSVGGGQATCSLGLGGYSNARAVYAPRTATEATDDDMGRIRAVCDVIEATTPTFGIEFTLDSRYQADHFEFLRKNEDDLTGRERLQIHALLATTQRLPASAAAKLLSRVTPRTGVTGVFAGSCRAAHEHALARHLEQHAVPLGPQADVLIVGPGPRGPFSHSASLNPLLVNHMANSCVYAQQRSQPLVKPGGTLILLHPCTDRFDHAQHTPYIEFVRHLLVETKDGEALHSRYEERFARDPALLEMFRTGHAYHPAHAFMLWYQSEPARRHVGRVIVVGADNEYVPNLLGYETALNLGEALYRARNGSAQAQDILCIHNYPSAVGYVSSPRSTK